MDATSNEWPAASHNVVIPAKAYWCPEKVAPLVSPVAKALRTLIRHTRESGYDEVEGEAPGLTGYEGLSCFPRTAVREGGNPISVGPTLRFAAAQAVLSDGRKMDSRFRGNDDIFSGGLRKWRSTLQRSAPRRSQQAAGLFQTMGAYGPLLLDCSSRNNNPAAASAPGRRAV